MKGAAPFSDRAFLLVLVIYIVLNLPFLTSYPPVDYTGDESWYMNYSIELIKTGRIKGSMFPFAGGLDEGNVFAPWLYSGALSAFFVFLGKGLWQGRLLSFLSGLAILYFTYRIGREFCGRTVGLAASAILASSIFFTWSMREIRPEAMFTAILLASFCFFYRFLASKNAKDIFLSGFLSALLIEVHPNAIVACLSLILLYGILYRKILSVGTIALMAGFIPVIVLWFFVNYLPYRGSGGPVSLLKVHENYLPPILEGEWGQIWYITRDRLAGLKEILISTEVYMNNIPLIFSFVLPGAAFVVWTLLVRRNLKLIAWLSLPLLTLWVSATIVGPRVFQVSYLTYYMPLFSLLIASLLLGIKGHLNPENEIAARPPGARNDGEKPSAHASAVSAYAIAILIGAIIASNIIDAAETNLRFKEYKKRYDNMMHELKTTLPQHAAVLGSTNYYQAFQGNDRYYTWKFMQYSCPDFGRTVRTLNVDYIILDDILRNLSIRWCFDAYYERKIVPFLVKQCELLKSIMVGYPNFNGTDNFLREVHIYKIKKE